MHRDTKRSSFHKIFFTVKPNFVLHTQTPTAPNSLPSRPSVASSIAYKDKNMCISKIRNRRPYPTNGFNSRGAIATPFPAPSSSVNENSASGPLLSTVALKESLLLRKTSSPTTVVDDGKTHKHPRIVAQHDYHDHSCDSRTNYKEDLPARGGVTLPFPLKLHEMLDAVEANGMEDIVSWQPHGRCFLVHKPKDFIEQLPHFFKLSKLASFQRQLNLYGFQRLTKGGDKGGYYHELFLRNKVFLAHSIQRIKVKGTGVRARSNPEQEPDFWAMPWVESSTQGNDVTVSSDSAVSKATSSFQLQQEDLFSTQLPLELEPTAIPQTYSLFPLKQQPELVPDDSDEDLLPGFGDKKFHYLDPFKPQHHQQTSPQLPGKQWSLSCEDELFTSEVEAFFQGFDFPQDIASDINDDDAFGDLLEQIIA